MNKELLTRYHIMMGEVVSVMLQSKRHRLLQVAGIGVWIDPGIILHQLMVLRDSSELPYAYLCWASVSDEILYELKNNPGRILHISEWNEGNNMWAMDFACRDGATQKALEEMQRLFDVDITKIVAPLLNG